MEKVFAGTIRDKEKFDVMQLTGSGESSAATTPLKYHDKDVDGKCYKYILIDNISLTVIHFSNEIQ